MCDSCRGGQSAIPVAPEATRDGVGPGYHAYVSSEHEARNGTSQPVVQRSGNLRRWLGAIFVTGTRYLFTRIPLYRRDRGAGSDPTLPDFGRELPGDPATVQRAADGSGALYHRRFWIDFTDADLGPEGLIRTLAGDLNAAAPGEMSSFETSERTGGTGDPLQVGEELVVRLPGPWDGPVRVIDRSPRSFRFATLRGHMEAGEIEFRSGRTDRGYVRFEIETWARSGDRRFRLLYDALPLAREAQAYMWSHFCARTPKLANGIVMSNVAVDTRRLETGPWLGDVAIDRPVRTTAPVSGETRRLLHTLPGRPYNFDPDDHDAHTSEAGWNLDDYCVPLPGEPPGPPVAGGSWAVARRLCEDYEFVDPRLVRAAYFTDVPLTRRDIALEGRFAGMRFPLGLRVGAVLDRTDDIDGRAARRWGWNYRTLHGHLERGQMDFEVRKWLDDGAVEFRITAYSQRAHIDDPFVRTGLWLFGRALQLRFARLALRRMRHLVERETSKATQVSSGRAGTAGRD